MSSSIKQEDGAANWTEIIMSVNQTSKEGGAKPTVKSEGKLIQFIKGLLGCQFTTDINR